MRREADRGGFVSCDLWVHLNDYLKLIMFKNKGTLKKSQNKDIKKKRGCFICVDIRSFVAFQQ